MRLTAVKYTLIHTLLELAALPVHILVFLVRRGRAKQAVLDALQEATQRRIDTAATDPVSRPLVDE